MCGCIVYLKADNACKAIICYLVPPVSYILCRGVSQVDTIAPLVHRRVFSVQLYSMRDHRVDNNLMMSLTRVLQIQPVMKQRSCVPS